MKTIQEHEVIVHGVEHEQYFQGCGVSFTRFDDVATGIGDNVQEAYDDALEALAQGDWNVDTLPEAAPGDHDDVHVYQGSSEDCEDSGEIHVYVSVRVR